jgi:DNA polymerase epsilon subunit 4
MCSNPAAFAMTVATELFIQYLAEQAHTVVKSERKPRKNIQYKDLASAISRNDTLEFLSDIVPKTVPYKEVKAKKAAASSANGAASNSNGAADPNQTTLDDSGSKHRRGPSLNGVSLNGVIEIEKDDADADGAGHGEEENGDGEAEDEDPSTQLRMEIRNARSSRENGAGRNRATRAEEGDGDVEMSQ